MHNSHDIHRLAEKLREAANELEVMQFHLDVAYHHTDQLEQSVKEWQAAAGMAYHFPTHSPNHGPLNCWQCREAVEAYEKAKKGSGLNA